MAKKQAKPFEQAYYPDLPNFDMGRIELQQAPSLYDDLSRWLAQNWYGTDPQGMSKARRAVDVGQIAFPPAGLAIGANEVTRDLRQGRPAKEVAIDSLLAGVMPLPPGVKKLAKPFKQTLYHAGHATPDFSTGGFFAFDKDLAHAYTEGTAKQVHEAEVTLHNPLELKTGKDVKKLWEKVGQGEVFHGTPTSSQALLKKYAESLGHDGVIVYPSAFNGEIGYEWAGGTFGEPQVMAFNKEGINIKPKPPTLEKTLQTLDEAILKLKGPVEVPKSQLADNLKALKAKQFVEDQLALGKVNKAKYDEAAAKAKPSLFNQEPLIAGKLPEPLITDFSEFDNPIAKIAAAENQTAANKASGKFDLQAKGPYDDYYANTSATEDDLDKYFPGEIPPFHSLSDADITDLEMFTHDNKVKNFQEEQYDYELPASPAISHGSAKGLDVSHISRHKFDAFDINKVLTGEGTIMEGYGPYTTNEPEVLPYYIRQFTERNKNIDATLGNPELNALDAIDAYSSGDLNPVEALDMIQNDLNNPKFEFPFAIDKETKKLLADWHKRGIPENIISKPYRYDVNMDVDPAMMPEYRKTLYNQDAKVQKLIKDAYMEHPNVYQADTYKKTYEDLYNEIFRAEMQKRGLKNPSHVGSVRPDHFNIGGKGTPRDAAAATSAYLYGKGIPGHKYLPAEGAYGDQGTRNFVSYHHEYMKIIKRIKLALAAGIPTAVLAQQYGSDNVEAAQADSVKPDKPVKQEEQTVNMPAKSSNLYAYPSGAFWGEEGPWARLYPRKK